MKDTEVNQALYEELHKAIARFGAEFDVTLPAVIGILEIIKLELIRDNSHDDDEEGEEWKES